MAASSFCSKADILGQGCGQEAARQRTAGLKRSGVMPGEGAQAGHGGAHILEQSCHLYWGSSSQLSTSPPHNPSRCEVPAGSAFLPLVRAALLREQNWGPSGEVEMYLH